MSNACMRKLAKFEELDELASTKNGGRILFATDDFFAVAENLLSDDEPRSNDEFTEFGKWMDGWETRRKRMPGHDWTIIALGKPSIIKEICVDTAFFTGNFAPQFSIQAARLTKAVHGKFPTRKSVMGTAAAKEALKKMAALKTEKWTTLVPMNKLKPGLPDTRKSYFDVDSNEIWTHLRLNIYPDGGIARLRIYGTTCRGLDVNESPKMIDLIEKKNGGVCEGCSDNHYGNPANVIKGDKALNMADGWETARRLDRPPIIRISDSGILEVPGEEWAIFRLGKVGTVKFIIVDTTYNKGNFPYSVQVKGTFVPNNRSEEYQKKWITVLPPKILSGHQEHAYTHEEIVNNGPFTHVKIIIAPDGGISRFKLLGYPEEDLDNGASQI